MSFDERSGAPAFEALTGLNVSAQEVARAAQILATLTSDYQKRLADVHPATELNRAEVDRLERLALILVARASLVKALVESQFVRHHYPLDSEVV
jgi:DnaJ-domain-containing protein 1